MKRLSDKMIYRAIDAIIEVADRCKNRHQEFDQVLSLLRTLERQVNEGTIDV